MQDIVDRLPDTSWTVAGPGAETHAVERRLEGGAVLCFERLPFALAEGESRFLDPAFADPRSKNISLRGQGDALRGTAGGHGDQAALEAMLRRFRSQAESLVARLFPLYQGHITRGNTSVRPVEVQGRTTSWRKDDTRLHVDAFPSNPMCGTRLLRVFTNLNPEGKPRRWRVGEPFEDFARKFLATVPAPLPGSSALLHWLRITKARRSAYDHYMLQLHDLAKADLVYQKEAPQTAVDFAPGTTWVVFSDQVLHAAMGGQFMMEQTFYLDPAGLAQPATAPLAVLERLLGRRLLG
jgi:hypothetical protein